MWDDIIIGKGEKGTSACKVFDIEGNENISENKISYWISNCFLDTGMTIFKDTVEGQTLSNMRQNKVGIERINQWLDELVIKKMKPKDLMDKIKKVRPNFTKWARLQNKKKSKGCWVSKCRLTIRNCRSEPEVFEVRENEKAKRGQPAAHFEQFNVGRRPVVFGSLERHQQDRDYEVRVRRDCGYRGHSRKIIS